MTDFFDRLESELKVAAARQDAPAPERRKHRFMRSRALLAAVVAVAVAVPASAAVIDAFRPQRERDGLVRTAPRTTVTEGEDRYFGPWQAFVSDSSSGRCFGVRLLDPPGPIPGSTVEGCGTSNEPARIGGGDGPPRTALFGFAAPDAVRVRLQADGVEAREFDTHAVAGRQERFFFASVPRNPGDLANLRIVAVRGDGSPGGR